MSGCVTSSTRARRVITRVFPRRPPRTRRAASLLLRAAWVTAGFAEWVQVRAETAAIELETLTRRTP